MPTDINSALSNWILKFALSKGGVIVRWGVGYIIAAIAAKHIIPTDDLTQIQGGLTSGGLALVALAYGWAQYWINQKRSAGVKVIQTAANAALPFGSPLQTSVDGFAGNATLAALHASTPANVDIPKAVAVVAS